MRACVLTHEYDPAAVEAYFKRRPVLVAQRSLQLALELSGFGLALLGDLATNKLEVRGCVGVGRGCMLTDEGDTGV